MAEEEVQAVQTAASAVLRSSSAPRSCCVHGCGLYCGIRPILGIATVLVLRQISSHAVLDS